MILATDFDGTLFVDNEKIINNNIKMINLFREKGNIFLIITGRGLFSIKKELIRLNIKYDYLICNNGAMMFDSNDNVLSATYLEKKDVLSMIEIIEKNKYDFIFDDGFTYFYNNSNLNLNKITSIYIDSKTVKNAEIAIKEIDDKTNTYNYISPNWLNAVNKNINKLESLKKFIKITNQENKKIYTIGDAINDIPMIEYFSGGIMSFHEPSLNTLPNKNYDTLADYIKELI